MIKESQEVIRCPTEMLTDGCEFGNIDDVIKAIEGGEDVETTVFNYASPDKLFRRDKPIRESTHVLRRLFGMRMWIVNIDWSAPVLTVACCEGYLDIAMYLIEKGANINMGAPMVLACAMGHLDIVKILINAGFDLFSGLLFGCADFEPIKVAEKFKRDDVVKYLLEVRKVEGEDDG